VVHQSAAVAQPAATTTARLVLNVPADAKVYLVNQAMTLTGTTRNFSVPKLEGGKTYDYPIRVEIVRDGQTLTVSGQQKIKAGQTIELVCNEDGASLKLAHKDNQQGIGELTVTSSSNKLAQR
jgi:uncharacterized protein (TIGR03000 family)